MTAGRQPGQAGATDVARRLLGGVHQAATQVVVAVGAGVLFAGAGVIVVGAFAYALTGALIPPGPLGNEETGAPGP
jgi:hypothetical protein